MFTDSYFIHFGNVTKLTTHDLITQGFLVQATRTEMDYFT